MSYEKAFEQLKEFFENQPASTQALKKLKKGEEIRLIIDDHFECSLFNEGPGKPCLEKRPAQAPNVEFRLNPQAINRIETAPGHSMAQFGIEVVKEVVAGNVEIKVPGSIWGVLRGGYLRIILEAGPEFLQHLASHGFEGVGKITALIKKMKS